MRFKRFFVKIAVPVLILLLWSSAAPAFNRPWSDWYQLKDEALNGIWFSWKCNDGRCEWRWDNRYKSEVKISYSFRLIDTDGAEKRNKGEQRLASGPLESVEFVLAAKEFKGVEVEINEPKYTGPKSSNYVPSSTREVDEEKRIREAEANAEKERVQRQQEYEAQQRREDEEFDRQQRLAQKRADDAEFREQILDFGRSVTSNIVQSSQQLENNRRQLYEMERQQREDKERRQREKTRRQQDEQRRLEREANERRQQAVWDKIRDDEERERKAEQKRQESERVEREKQAQIIAEKKRQSQNEGVIKEKLFTSMDDQIISTYVYVQRKGKTEFEMTNQSTRWPAYFSMADCEANNIPIHKIEPGETQVVSCYPQIGKNDPPVRYRVRLKWTESN